jgi:hypothetical protein
MTMAIVRPSTPADGAAIIALLRDQLAWKADDPMADPRQMHWKYWQKRADWPGPRSFVLARGDEVLAHAAIVPGTCASRAGRFSLIHMVDWAAREGSVGAGIMLMKHIGRLADLLLAVGGSGRTLAILPALGFRPCGVGTRFVRPLRPLGYLAGRAEPRWRYMLRAARNTLWAISGTRRDRGRFDVRQLAAHEVTAPRRLPRPGPDMAVVERSAAMLTYALECPMTPMALHAVERSGNVCGYFLLAFAPGQSRLVDCWLDSDDPADWRLLIHAAVAQARKREDVVEVVTLASDPMLSTCLVDCGFHARSGQRPIHLLARNGHSVPETTLRVQMLDNDEAYIHHGRNNFWA